MKKREMRITKHKQNIIYASVCVFAICITTGYIAGNLIRANHKGSFAASGNITVADNSQVVTYERGNGSISKRSMVTVKDPAAVYGYNLTARIAQNSNLPVGTSVWVNGRQLSKTTPTLILTTDTDYLPLYPNGYTHELGVSIRLSSIASPGNYIIDIEYEEEAKVRPMRSFTSSDCSAMTTGSMITLRDTRDETHYRVKKMADNRCWTVDNLALDLTANYSGKPNWETYPVKETGAAAGTNTAPQIIVNNNIGGQGQIPNNGNPKSSYLYNWCAAMGDTSRECATTRGYTANQPAGPQTGVCPAPFRLPIGGAEATIAGNASTTTNEFAKLDIAMGGTGTNRNPANDTYSKWMGQGTSRDEWLGTLSGLFRDALEAQGVSGRWWSSMATSNTSVYYMTAVAADTLIWPANTTSSQSAQRIVAVNCFLKTRPAPSLLQLSLLPWIQGKVDPALPHLLNYAV